jgi:hypothetical protein
MKMRSAVLFAVGFVVFSGGAQSAAAQALPDTVLHAGARIRVQSPVFGSKTRVGNFVALERDTLSFTLAGETVPTLIPVQQVDALEISVKRTTNIVRDASKGSHYGGIIGAVIGGAVGIAGAGGDNTLRALLGFAGAIGGYFAGHMYGTVAGGVAGAIDRDDEWKPVMIPVRGT